MREKVSFAAAFLTLTALLPALLTFFLSGENQIFGQRLDAERVVPLLLAVELPEGLETETQKALAVVIRSNLWKSLEDGEKPVKFLRQVWETADKKTLTRLFGQYERCEQAAKQTRGQCLLFAGKRCIVPYHELSGGRTRDGAEVLGEDYAYLTGVDSAQDKNSDDYLTTVTAAKKGMPQAPEILRTDEEGYVLELSVQGQVMSGEYFRREMGLPSSCFTVRQSEEAVYFLCRGRGHGLGISVFGADTLAKAGSGYAEILAWYFPKLALEEL